MDQNGEDLKPGGVEKANPRETLASDINSIGKKVVDYFYSPEADQLRKTLPISDKETIIQRFATESLLSELRARVEGHYQYPSQRDHGVHMSYFTAQGELPTEIKQLLQSADLNDYNFVVNPKDGQVNSGSKVVEISDTQRNKRRYLFIRPGNDGSSLSMDTLDVIEGNKVSDEDDSGEEQKPQQKVVARFQGINHNLGLSNVSDFLAQFCR